jgi:transketolase
MLQKLIFSHDLDAIDKAITKAKSQNGPTMIEVKTIIGYGAPNVVPLTFGAP